MDDTLTWLINLQQKISSFHDKTNIFSVFNHAVHEVGFDYFAYGIRQATPSNHPDFTLYGSYPAKWISRYNKMRYHEDDPLIANGLDSTQLNIWCDSIIHTNPLLFSEAREYGLAVGATISCHGPDNSLRTLSLVRSYNDISLYEEKKLSIISRILLDILTDGLSNTHQLLGKNKVIMLTPREHEILKWTAAGKSSEEIATILGISYNTVNFHIKNINKKYSSNNKIAAAVQYAAQGLL